MVHLSDQQWRAVKAIAGQVRNGAKRSWLAGYAGSGKSTLAPFLVEEAGARHALFCAPTNKAARVLAGKVGAPAMSLHKAIYFPPDEDGDSRGGLRWQVCPNAPASSADLIVVDEASMVGQRIGNDLMSFGVPVIAIGDPGQLPPVKDEPYFCVGEPEFMLTEIHRQARDNPIIRLSQDIREGRRLRHGSLGEEVRIVRPAEVEVPDDPNDCPQIITGRHATRWRVTAILRDHYGHAGWLPNPGEPVICKKNSQETPLINGMLCQTVHCRPGTSGQCRMNIFDDSNNWLEVDVSTALFNEHTSRKTDPFSQRTRHELFDFAWAITCHSAQGSQWDQVLVYDESNVFRNDATRWAYTAVTRAAKKLTIIL